MLNRAFREAGINAVYTAFHVLPERLEEAVRGVRALGFGGVNVTIPHKVAMLDLMDELDETAAAIGAVNTVVNRDGRLIGFNTDGIGYVRSLKEETGLSVEGKHVAVIGAGGAARGIVYALLKERPERVIILNRTPSSAERLASDMRRYGAAEGCGLPELAKLKDEVDILINTTSVGMHPHVEETPVASELLTPRMTVSDIVYNPARTRLLAEAEARGCRIHGGLGMFIYQGAYAFEYWTGKPAPVAAMREVVEQSQ
jgi:shikimate dehydrogenase